MYVFVHTGDYAYLLQCYVQKLLHLSVVAFIDLASCLCMHVERTSAAKQVRQYGEQAGSQIGEFLQPVDMASLVLAV